MTAGFYNKLLNAVNNLFKDVSTVCLMVEFGERLKEAFNNESNTQIAQKLGITYQAVKNYVEGRIPSGEVLIRISNITNCSIHWLLTGEGSKRVSQKVKSLEEKRTQLGEIPVYLGESEHLILADLTKEQNTEKQDLIREFVIEALIQRGKLKDPSKVEGATLIYYGDAIPKLVKVRLLGTIAAGEPLEAFEEYEEVEVPETFIIAGHETVVWKVKGDSMKEDGILHGDLIVCYFSPGAYNGQRVAALIDETSATVKKFYREGKFIRLQPANDEHEPLIVRADRVRILAIVLGIYRPM